MIRQNSERIFLEPIDQHYDNQRLSDSPHYDNQSKFFEDYTHGVMDYLDQSTDSDTKHNSFEEEVVDGKITELLTSDWKNKVDYFKTYQLSVLRNCVFQKMHFLRSSLNMSMGHTYERPNSCHSVRLRSDCQPASPFVVKKDSDASSRSDECREGKHENGVINVIKVKESFFKNKC
jgi:hypothetical protein